MYSVQCKLYMVYAVAMVTVKYGFDVELRVVVVSLDHHDAVVPDILAGEPVVP